MNKFIILLLITMTNIFSLQSELEPVKCTASFDDTKQKAIIEWDGSSFCNYKIYREIMFFNSIQSAEKPTLIGEVQSSKGYFVDDLSELQDTFYYMKSTLRYTVYAEIVSANEILINKHIKYSLENSYEIKSLKDSLQCSKNNLEKEEKRKRNSILVATTTAILTIIFSVKAVEDDYGIGDSLLATTFGITSFTSSLLAYGFGINIDFYKPKISECENKLNNNIKEEKEKVKKYIDRNIELNLPITNLTINEIINNVDEEEKRLRMLEEEEEKRLRMLEEEEESNLNIKNITRQYKNLYYLTNRYDIKNKIYKSNYIGDVERDIDTDYSTIINEDYYSLSYKYCYLDISNCLTSIDYGGYCSTTGTLYKITFQSESVTADKYDTKLKEKFKSLFSVLSNKYKNITYPSLPNRRDKASIAYYISFPPFYDIDNGYLRLATKWTEGNKIIEIRIGEDDCKYYIQLKIYDKNISEILDKKENIKEKLLIKESIKNF